MKIDGLGYKIDVSKVSFIGAIKTYEKTEHFFTVVVDGVKICIEHSGAIAQLESARESLGTAFDDV